MQTEVVILTEAGAGFGYGHLMRCLAIAQGFRERNITTEFFLRGDADPGKILQDFSWYSIDWLVSHVNVAGKIVVLDSYYADEGFCSKVYSESAAVLFIDDYNRIQYPGGFVLNSVIGAEEIGYPKNDKITYLLGPKYHPIRKEFWDVPEKVINDNIGKVLITFGGTDLTNETPGVLNILKKNYPDLEKHVVIGKGFSNIDEIKAAADQNTYLLFEPDAERMKREMLECDIAISAAGQTVYELARVGVTTFAKKVVDNQLNIIRNWNRNNFLVDFELFDSFPDFNTRFEKCHIGRSLIDGIGVFRIVELLLHG